MLTVIKAGGKLIEDPIQFEKLMNWMSGLKHPFIFIHGGGNTAGELSRKLGNDVKMHEGRRITDRQTLDVAVMVYAGLINKKLVAELVSRGKKALGLSGADANIILSQKRNPSPIDFGWVGDIEKVDHQILKMFLEKGLTPVLCAITHDGKGNLLNTNADSLANHVACAMSNLYPVELMLCFEKRGVLLDEKDELSLIPKITFREMENLKKKEIIHSGMIPKLESGFKAIQGGVSRVAIGNPDSIKSGQCTILKP
jgi:acetylglutamate kinase